MADEASKVFPMFPVKNWWTIREQFKKTIPSVVDAKYVATLLGMREQSARINILYPMRQLGLISEEGKRSDRAVKWRDDGQYPDACKEMLKEVYPVGLRELATDPDKDRDKAERWFATTTKAGASAVGKMLAVYLMLLRANLAEGAGEKPRRAAAPRTDKPIAKPPRKAAPAETGIAVTPNTQRPRSPNSASTSRLRYLPTRHRSRSTTFSPAWPST